LAQLVGLAVTWLMRWCATVGLSVGLIAIPTAFVMPRMAQI